MIHNKEYDKLIKILKLIAKSVSIDCVDRNNVIVYKKVYKPQNYNDLEIQTYEGKSIQAIEHESLLRCVVNEYEEYKKNKMKIRVSSIFPFPIVEELVKYTKIDKFKKNEYEQIVYRLELYDDITVELITQSYINIEKNNYISMGLDYTRTESGYVMFSQRLQQIYLYTNVANDLINNIKIKFDEYYYMLGNDGKIILYYDTLNENEQLYKYLKEHNRIN